MGVDYRRYPQKENKLVRPHPVWRGIGCLLMIVIPVISFGLADVLMPTLSTVLPGFNLPAQLEGTVEIVPGWVVNDFGAVLGLTVLIAFALYAVLAIVNSIVYSATINKDLKAFDTPGQRYKKKKR